MEKSIENELSLLEKEARKLDQNKEERKNLFESYRELSEQFLEELPGKNTYNEKTPESNLYHISGQPKNQEKIKSILQNDLFEVGLNAASGGHLGYIPGGGIYTAAIGDYLAAICNAYSGVYYANPGAVEMEHACLNWLKSIFNFPTTAIGNLTSGGSIANLIALTAARDDKEILEDDVQKSVVYLTSQVHHSVKKALKIIGLHKVTIRTIPTDSMNRMDAKVLAQQIEKDKTNELKPAILIASAGTTDTGAIDPLDDLSVIAKQHKIWFHIDAAYGGFFILTEAGKTKLKGIEKADSLVCDPHKGLFLPYGIGAVLIKSSQAVFESHKVSAHYMQDAIAENIPVDPADVSPELTKHFRALRMWLPLQTMGIQPFKAALEEKLLLTQYFRNKVEKLGFKVGPTPDLSVTYFWYPFQENQNQNNQKLMDLCHEDGRVFLSSTKVNDQFVIRMAILSFRTHKAEIDKALEMLDENIKKMRKDTSEL